MSERTLQFSTHNNNADNLERDLKADNHKTWGFVIYRCTYASASDWEESMSRFNYRIRETMEIYNGVDMLDSLAMTVFDDQILFDGASTSFIREHFKQWAATAPETEQGTGPAQSPRYRYCIQVDATCLNSIVYNAPAPPIPDASTKGFVNLIDKDWTPDLDGEEAEGELEGCKLEEVGWMRVAYQDVMVDFHQYLRGWNNWYHEYRRLPVVGTA